MTKKKEIKPKKPTTEERLDQIVARLSSVQYELHGVNTWCYRNLNDIKTQLTGVRSKFQTSTYWLGFLSGLTIGLIVVAVK